MVWRFYVEHPATGKLDIERLKRLGIFKIFDRLNHKTSIMADDTNLRTFAGPAPS
jgi:hypothetical protein